MWSRAKISVFVAGLVAVGLLTSFVAPAASQPPTGQSSGIASQQQLAEDTAARQQRATIIFGGDIMLGRYVEQVASSRYPAYPFAPISPTLRAADYVVANLESPLTNVVSPTRAVRWINIKASPAQAAALPAAGIDLVSLANNHATDYGRQALTDTIASLKAVGVAYTGVGGARVATINGLRVAFLGYTCIAPSGPDLRLNVLPCDYDLKASTERLQGDIAAAKGQAGAVVVLIHWGNEYTSLPLDYQRKLAAVMAEAGATLVVGAHPHQVQSMERIGSTLVAYSLGNFIFDQNFSPLTKNSLLLRVVLDRRGVVAANSIPLSTYLQARLLDPGDKGGQAVTAEAARGSADDFDWQTMRPAAPLSTLKAPPAPLSPTLALAYQRSDPPAQSQLADLNADGKAELITLQQQHLTLYQADAAGNWQAAWQSDSLWQVESFAVADAFGRGPMLAFILWQPDYRWGGAGKLKNQIFIYGWAREGWRAVWAGRPLADAAHQLSFFVASDGQPRLAVLEGNDSSKLQVSVWSWNGFGYSLDWRSPGAGYSSLFTDSLTHQVFYRLSSCCTGKEGSSCVFVLVPLVGWRSC